MSRLLFIFTILFVVGNSLLAEEKKDAQAEYRIEADISYLEEGTTATPYQRERCRLEVYCPNNKAGFATVVWFHGGGLTAGNYKGPRNLDHRIR